MTHIISKTAKELINVLFIICSLLFSVCACVDNDDVPETMYTAKKMTAGAFLESHQERYSEFIALLKRTPYFSLMTTGSVGNA